MKKVLIISAIWFAGVLSTYAQRTMDKQCSISADGSFNGISWGTGLQVAGYTLSGFWYGGIEWNNNIAALSNGSKMQYCHLTGNGGYMLRIANTRKRGVNLYGGGGIFCGIEMIDPFRRLSENIETGLNGIAFLYGLEAGLLAEFFISKKIALTLSAMVLPNFSSQIGWFSYQAGAGLKIML